MNPGTLRWCLAQAANNNNGTVYDTIRFNIPSGQPAARAIQLLSELPKLTSYLIIDGTTQLQGAPFGLTDAKIQIFPQSFPNCKRGFIMENIDHVEIYGIGFAGFINQDPTQFETYRDAIFMWNCHDIIIGAPGKGNAFTASFHCIRHEAIPPRPNDPPPPGIGYNITIQNNIIGKNNTGRPLNREGCVIGIKLLDVYDVTIGGWLPQQENDFMIFLQAISLGLKTPAASTQSNILIANNSLIRGTTTIPFPAPIPLTGFAVSQNSVANPGNHFVHISGNDMLTVSTGISLSGIKNHFLLVNNTVNCNRNNNDFPATSGILLNSCDSGLIGGIDSINTIINADNNGITEAFCRYIEKRQNIMYCNALGISIGNPAVPPSKIYDMYVDAAGTVFGKTDNNAAVEIFAINSCAAEYYNGETFLKKLTADATGNFTYPEGIDCFNKSFTSTNTNKSTSKFYVLNDFIADTNTVQIIHATCGRSNGSILGVKIFSGVDFHWEDAQGFTVGTDTNLVNVGPGLYRLVADKQNVACNITTGYYQVLNTQPVVNGATAVLTHPVPQCNRLGSITGIIVSGIAPPFRVYRWTDQLGNTVGTNLNLLNVPAGTYRLTVSVSYDPTCIATAGPFILVDRLAPAFDFTGLRISDASCGRNNGSITGIAIVNITGIQSFKWVDAAGSVVGTNINLTNALPGVYHLQYDDASPCPPINSPDYTIGNNGLVTLDESNAIITPSGCTRANGSISNIAVTGANRFEWVNEISGAIIGNTLNLTNVPPGLYRLRVYDTNFGCADSSSAITVSQTSIVPLTLNDRTIKDETCSASNGSITNISLSPTPVFYTFKWVKNSIDTFSTLLNVTGLTQGDYQLLAIDTNGCSQSVLQQTLIDHPSPVLDESSKKITDDECTLGIGSISGLKASGGDPPLSYQWNKNNQPFLFQQDINKLFAGNYQLLVIDKN